MALASDTGRDPLSRRRDRHEELQRVSTQRTAAIVANTVDLARRLGTRVVAEGVEDEATLRTLRQLGCDETQGYLHARPMAADDFAAWLEDARVRQMPALSLVIDGIRPTS
jgi:EAL domain-containing protein (putative c-di-GMP-specific phosphodiesterase class I)